MAKTLYLSCLATRQITTPRTTPAVGSIIGPLQASGGWDISNCHNCCHHKHFPQPLTPWDFHTKVGGQAWNFPCFQGGHYMMLCSSENQAPQLVLLFVDIDHCQGLRVSLSSSILEKLPIRDQEET